jgi:hypothetical protein
MRISIDRFVCRFLSALFMLALAGTHSEIILAAEVPQTQNSQDNIPGEVLVRVKDGVPVSQVAALAKSMGAHLDRRVTSWGLYLFKFSDSAPIDEVVARLRQHPAVQYAEPNGKVQLFGAGDGSGSGSENPAVGNPILVAVIDTGIDLNHAAFAGHLYENTREIPGDGIDNDGNGYIDDVNGFDFYGRSGSPMGTAGSGAHGTQVAGRILQGAVDAPVSVMALKVGPGPSLSLAAIVEAIDYAVNNGAKVINMSLGATVAYQALSEAVQRAINRGVIVVAAAGNSGAVTPNYPAALPGVISVAASDANGVKTWWSNYGSTVDFTAPGDQVVTTTFGGGTAAVSGTSFSAPLVAGMVARVLSAMPNLGVNEVINHLKTFAKEIYSLNHSFYQGKLGQGLLDEQVASRIAQAFPLTPRSPADQPQNQRDILDAQLAAAQQEVARLEGELSAADRNLSAAHEVTVQATSVADQASQRANQAWKDFTAAWSAWFRASYSVRVSPQERESLRMRMQEASQKMNKANAEKQDAQARLRVAQSEENRIRTQRESIASQLRSARQQVDDLNRRISTLVNPAQRGPQAETNSLLGRLRAISQSLSFGPSGLGMKESSELSFSGRGQNEQNQSS